MFRDYGHGADAALLATDTEQFDGVVAALADRRLKKALSKLLERRDKSLEQILQHYRERAEKYIKQRNQRSYRQAIKILRELRGICATEERLAEWLGCMEELRSRYGNLRAFLDELDKAGL
ncbi:hypothetical protein [Spirulina sp. 06S082]|uniref:hypothetical protein n=1 Tax=Spirulina sp. 06S082 TaxID=3110248 RepID=UPI002B21C091|nr:hypothetical protein [Spirulina sp. 06S082]MEA5468639.1 hypothetical protein [Spirulina sp. 06S082]